MEDFPILQLLLDDVDKQLDQFELGAHPDHTSPPAYGSEGRELDGKVALQVWKSEIERQLGILRDRQTAEDLALEETAEEVQLPKISFTKRIATAIWKLLTSLKRVFGFSTIMGGFKSKSRMCTCCHTTLGKFLKAPCSHFYCSTCLAIMATKFVKGMSTSPPQCCSQPITISKMKKVIGVTLDERFENKLIEFNDTDKTYCANVRCLRYLVYKRSLWSRLTTRRICRCECGFRTCRKCKSVAHGGDCLHPVDHVFEEMKLAFRWQDCFKCGRVIERTRGCAHITCICRAEWCYDCGKKWKTCHCSWAISSSKVKSWNKCLYACI
ncbi:unnamed protein product [Penicillium salamii]|uniref:RBR-type E3 ubiquitin transferase n=1 Tax=Penicillium salamii TaxID=1612424 RepID=A0A9W4JIR8_9EURO|nr:unnamed protein product [Penicillium salamii]CAG8117713.1 unnamed protein product [Penicillium salamii]CAG8130951.1 unnamed protein product [Penicillium salamii]CAG8266427.1 unnamed protein product [Penicillium salamii]CAG8297045.1 unnamed protein product [Penicillium salamii]